MKYEQVIEIREKLKEYADWEGTEIGEMCATLIQLSHYLDYMSESFQKELCNELKSQLDMFETSTKIVERTQTFTRTVKDLEWIR